MTNNEEVFSFFSVAHMDQFFIYQQTEIEMIVMIMILMMIMMMIIMIMLLLAQMD